MFNFSKIDPLAAYAAIIATGALALEIRRWFESGVKLYLNIMPQARTVGMQQYEGKDMISVTVSNRDDSPTTLTHFALADYGNYFRWLIGREEWTAIVLKTSIAGNTDLPQTLQPGETWQGACVYDLELLEKAKRGFVYARISGSHSNKPVSRAVKLKKEAISTISNGFKP